MSIENTLFDDVFIFVPAVGKIVRIAEGTGDNLLSEDIDEGYVDYIYYDIYNLDSNLTEDDGGMILTTQLIREKYEKLEDCIPEVLDMAYSNQCLEFVLLRKI